MIPTDDPTDDSTDDPTDDSTDDPTDDSTDDPIDDQHKHKCKYNGSKHFLIHSILIS